MWKASAEPPPAVKNKISINKWLNLKFPYFFNILCTFWPNAILFQGLRNRLQNSILFQYFQTAWEPWTSYTLLLANAAQSANWRSAATHITNRVTRTHLQHNTDHWGDFDSPPIIGKWRLQILESLWILKHKQELNVNTSMHLVNVVRLCALTCDVIKLW